MIIQTVRKHAIGELIPREFLLVIGTHRKYLMEQSWLDFANLSGPVSRDDRETISAIAP